MIGEWLAHGLSLELAGDIDTGVKLHEERADSDAQSPVLHEADLGDLAEYF